MIWKTMIAAEMSFRKLDAPDLVERAVERKRDEIGQEVGEVA